MKILVYTFESFKHKEYLFKEFERVVVLRKLGQDLKILQERIVEILSQAQNDNPVRIIGFGNHRYSSIKTVAWNKFGKRNLINKNGKDFYNLDIPSDVYPKLNICKSQDHSFCNWAAYKVAEFIDQNNLDIKNSFVHLDRDRKFSVSTTYN